MHAYFVFGVLIQYCFSYFFAKIVPTLAIWSCFSCLLCHFDVPLPLWDFFSLMKHSILLDNTRYSRLFLYTSFPSPSVRHFSEDSCSFYWRIVLETNIWALSMLISILIWLLLGSLSWKNNEIYVYIITCMYASFYKYFTV